MNPKKNVIQKKIKKQLGYSLPEVMVAALILGVAILMSSKVFVGILKSQMNIEQAQFSTNTYFDIFNTLTDERNCKETFKFLTANQLRSSRPNEKINIVDIKDASGFNIFSVDKKENSVHKSMHINEISLVNKRVYADTTHLDDSGAPVSTDEFKLDAELDLQIMRQDKFDEISNGAKAYNRKINMTFILDKNPSRFKRVSRCWASAGLYVSKSEFPICPDGNILIYQDGLPRCSVDVAGVVSNNVNIDLDCNSASTSYNSMLGTRCASASNVILPQFWVRSDESNFNVSHGVSLGTYDYKSVSRGKLFIKAVIPVYYEQGVNNGERPGYEAAFLAAIWIKEKNSPDSYRLAAQGQIFDPYSRPYGFIEYNIPSVGTVKHNVSVGTDFGGNGYIVGEIDGIKENTDYSVAVKVFSIRGYDDINANGLYQPKASFGTIKLNNQFARGFINIKELSGN